MVFTEDNFSTTYCFTKYAVSKLCQIIIDRKSLCNSSRVRKRDVAYYTYYVSNLYYYLSNLLVCPFIHKFNISVLGNFYATWFLKPLPYHANHFGIKSENPARNVYCQGTYFLIKKCIGFIVLKFIICLSVS